MQKVSIVFAILVSIFSSSGCGPPTRPSDQTATSASAPIAENILAPATIPSEPTLAVAKSEELIFNAIPTQSATPTVRLSRNTFVGDPPTQTIELINWIKNDLISNKALTIIEDKPSCCGWAKNSGARTVVLQDERGGFIKASYVLNSSVVLAAVEFNPYYISEINVLDTTISPNGKLAEIIYTLNYTLTELGKVISQTAEYASVVELPQPTQIQAKMRRLDITGWQVDPTAGFQ